MVDEEDGDELRPSGHRAIGFRHRSDPAERQCQLPKSRRCYRSGYVEIGHAGRFWDLRVRITLGVYCP